MMDREQLINLLGEDMVQGAPQPGIQPTHMSAGVLPDESLIPERDKRIIEERTKALEKMFAVTNRGKYKICLAMTDNLNRQTQPLWRGMITFFENGRRLVDGGNDRGVYLCPGKLLGINDCYAIIPSYANKNDVLICARCGTCWRGEQVIGHTLGNSTLSRWSQVLAAHITQRLEDSADIVAIIHPPGLHAATEEEMAKTHHGDKIFKFEKQARRHEYYNEDLRRDMAAGARLVDRIYAFLRSL